MEEGGTCSCLRCCARRAMVVRGFACGLLHVSTWSRAAVNLERRQDPLQGTVRRRRGSHQSKEGGEAEKNSSPQLLLLDSHTCPLGTARELDAEADGCVGPGRWQTQWGPTRGRLTAAGAMGPAINGRGGGGGS
jgi:hypothetical protein